MKIMRTMKSKQTQVENRLIQKILQTQGMKLMMKVKMGEKKRLVIHLRGGLLLSVSGMEETSTGTVFSSSCWRPSTTTVLEWSTTWSNGSTRGILSFGRVPYTSGGAVSHCGQLGSCPFTVPSP